MRCKRIKSSLFGTVAALSLGAASVLALQSDAWSSGGDRPVLHTYIIPPEGDEGTAKGTAGDGDGGGRGGGGGLGGDPGIPAPDEQTNRPRKGEPVYGARDGQAGGGATEGGATEGGSAGDGAAERDKVRPDTDTVHEGDGVYHAVFNPTVAPMKRSNSVDKVNRFFEISVSDERVRRVSMVDRRVVSGRDFFWGSFLVKNKVRALIPIPSVSPGMVPHEVRTSPKGFGVEFYKDGADNFFVKLRRSAAMGNAAKRVEKVRVQVLVSGARDYFGGPLPSNMNLRDMRTAPPELPGNVASKAGMVLNHIGLSRGDSFKDQLYGLVRYFRGFEEGPMDKGASTTGNAYLDLSFSKKGVCRHRSYAFVITAQALGIPSRYVNNELHVFVEVLLPRIGWRRIDLGGATPQLEILHGKNHVPHRPPSDPFPQTPGAGDGQPNPLDSRAAVDDGKDGNDGNCSKKDKERGSPGSFWNPLDLDQKGVDSGAWVDAQKLGLVGESVLSGNDPGGGDGPAATASDKGKADGDETANKSSFSNFLKTLTESSSPDTLSTRVVQPVAFSPLSVNTSGLRGDSIKVAGGVNSGEKPLRNHRVVVLFYPPDSNAAVVVGETVTGDRGEYRLETLVPKDIPVGVYKVHAHTPKQGVFDKATSP